MVYFEGSCRCHIYTICSHHDIAKVTLNTNQSINTSLLVFLFCKDDYDFQSFFTIRVHDESLQKRVVRTNLLSFLSLGQ